MNRLLLTLLTAGCFAAPVAAQTVSLASLLDEMTSRKTLAQFPDPAYTCRQFSSYDRDTVAPDQPGWFANWDRSQFLRVEQREGREEHVMMDADGPGAVVRFWATWHGPGGGEFTNGTLRVYLDGNDQPTIEAPIAEVIDGGLLAGPPLSQGVSPETQYPQRGHNLYLPIPYAKHCKITYSTTALIDRGAKKGEALYYQINYRTYEASTSVETFSREKLEQLRPLIERTQKRLTQSGWIDLEDWDVIANPGELAPGASRSLRVDHGGAIYQLTIRLKADQLPQALRSTVLLLECDGQNTGWCPVGDFYGIGYRLQPYRTWYTNVKEDGQLTCYWIMPFQKSIRVTLHNFGEQDVQVEKFDAHVGAWDWDDRSLHFHTTWRQLTEVDTKGGKGMDGNGAFDVNYVTVQGKGVYAGDTLSVFNGTDAWWGEGDEKIFVDGESFPSHVGTGTEDYYGYAWCKPAYFQAPFHAQPSGHGNLTVGFTANSRYRALDAIPFERSIQFDMELWHWAGTRVNYAPTTFWYARPGATWNVTGDPYTVTRPVAQKREDVVPIWHAPGAIEGETLKILEKTGGVTEIQNIPMHRWSNDQQLWWRDAKIGDRLVLEFPVTEGGKYQVLANLTKAIDYGIVKLSVDDQPAVEFDRFHSQVAHDPLELGALQLAPGSHRLTIEISGQHPDAVPRHMFGLDYLQLVPQP